MTDTPKPPPVLYFRENISTVYMDGSHMDDRFGHAFANKKRESDVGPYVHLDQFLAQVERRADRRASDIAQRMGGEYYTPDYYWAEKARQLAKAIKEGKA